MKPFQGNIITTGLTADQLFELIKIAVREVLEQDENTLPDDNLPDLVPRVDAAKYLGYKNPDSLVQYHFQGLKPERRGKYLFYNKDEVVRLRMRLFNLRK